MTKRKEGNKSINKISLIKRLSYYINDFEERMDINDLEEKYLIFAFVLLIIWIILIITGVFKY